MIKQSVPPPPRTLASLFPQTRTYMRQVLEGICYLHQSRVLHLDVKVRRGVASMQEVGLPYGVFFLNQFPCLGYSRRTCWCGMVQGVKSRCASVTSGTPRNSLRGSPSTVSMAHRSL